jgi:hypothetical protein
MGKKKIPPQVEALSEGMQRLFDVLNHESDLAAVLIGASYLDECLASMLHRAFVQGETSGRLLDSSTGVLGSYSARADLAYVLGLVSKPAVADLRVVGELRNLFAHSRLTLELSSPPAKAIVDRLKYLSVLREEMRLNHQIGEDEPSWLSDRLSPRDRFKLTVVMLSNHLLLKGLSVIPHQRFDGWVQEYSASRSKTAPRSRDEEAPNSAAPADQKAPLSGR